MNEELRYSSDVTEDMIKEAKRQYHREWRKKNPDKAKVISDRYWLKKATQLKVEDDKHEITDLDELNTKFTGSQFLGFVENQYSKRPEVGEEGFLAISFLLRTKEDHVYNILCMENGEFVHDVRSEVGEYSGIRVIISECKQEDCK